MIIDWVKDDLAQMQTYQPMTVFVWLGKETVAPAFSTGLGVILVASARQPLNTQRETLTASTRQPLNVRTEE